MCSAASGDAGHRQAQLSGSPFLDRKRGTQATLEDRRDTIGDGHDLVQILGDHEHRGACGGDPAACDGSGDGADVQPQVGWLATINTGASLPPTASAGENEFLHVAARERARRHLDARQADVEAFHQRYGEGARGGTRRIQPKRENEGVQAFGNGVLPTVRSPITPPRGGPGIRATLREIHARGLAGSASPVTVTRPRRAVARPQASPASACWPLPATPAIATISPARTRRLVLSSRPCRPAGC